MVKRLKMKTTYEKLHNGTLKNITIIREYTHLWTLKHHSNMKVCNLTIKTSVHFYGWTLRQGKATDDEYGKLGLWKNRPHIPV